MTITYRSSDEVQRKHEPVFGGVLIILIIIGLMVAVWTWL